MGSWVLEGLRCNVVSTYLINDRFIVLLVVYI